MTRPSPSVPVPPPPESAAAPDPAGPVDGGSVVAGSVVAGPVDGGRWRPPPAWLPVLDKVLRVAGGLLAAAAAALSATLELLLATLRVGGHLVGVSVLLAVVANAALSWFAHRAVGRGWAVAIPAVVWFGLMVVAAGGTAEGDILLAGDNWVGLGMIVAGSMAFAVVGFRMVLNPAPARIRR